MNLKETRAKLNDVLKNMLGKYEFVRPFGFLASPSQPGVLLNSIDLEVVVAVDRGELDGKTDAEIEVFLRQRLLDTIASTVKFVSDELEGK